MNFEANRKKMLEDLRKQKDGKKVFPTKSSYIPNDAHKEREKDTIVIFAQKSLFLSNLIASLGPMYKIELLYDVDKATDFIVEHGVKHVVVDIDPPSDYHNAANFLTVVKTVSAQTTIFVCTKDKNDSRARALSSHGGVILAKPLSIPELAEYIDGRKAT